jgi:hypothetical protein
LTLCRALSKFMVIRVMHRQVRGPSPVSTLLRRDGFSSFKVAHKNPPSRVPAEGGPVHDRDKDRTAR